MKKNKEKQTPIFLKVHDIRGDRSRVPLPEEPGQGQAVPPAEKAACSAELTRNPGAAPAWDGLSDKHEDQIMAAEILEEATTAAEVSLRVIQPPQGIEAVVNSLGMVFVLIPAGTFVMGSPDYEPGRHEDELPHEVTISRSFYLQATPVTRGQWQAVVGPEAADQAMAGADLPRAGLNWQDCQGFLKKMNALGEGTYRLPTEAEWEYACRAGSDTAVANGDLLSLYCEPDPNLEEMAWYCGNSGRKLHPVGQKRPNAWGLYDLHGNVAEWCQDWYGAYPATPQSDPPGANSGPGRVVRGGSWFSSAKNCRSAARFYWPPHSQSQLDFLGVRLVRER